MNISLDPEMMFIDDNGNVATFSTSYDGELAINQFDGDIYMVTRNGNNIVVYDSLGGNSIHTEGIGSPGKSIIFNPLRNSVWAVQPAINSLVEVEVILGVQATQTNGTQSSIQDGMYGTLDPYYVPPENIWLKAKDFVRTPKENMIGDQRIQYYWKWLTDDKPEFFLYDFIGHQLKYDNSVYSYKGNIPLQNIALNKKPNRDINSINIEQRQQTIFDTIRFDLDYLNEITDKFKRVNPYQLFIGYKSEIEGPQKSVLQLFKKEDIFFSFKPIDKDDILDIFYDDLDDNQIILKLDDNNSRYFTNLNTFDAYSGNDHKLKQNQIIELSLKDITNEENQYISYNNGLRLKIKNVYSKYIVAEKIDDVELESNIIENYPNEGNITYLEFGIKVIDKELGRFNVYGQTEEEDERFKIELGNVGKLIDPDDVFIFKEYDIEEGGIDWTILNRKRKEMLMMKHLIYPYIGAYKSIINAINYFGYNDLQLNEYYKNVKSNSPLFGQLYKVEIPKIFDKNAEGWVENDFIKHTYPNKNYEATNLFNLTYFITDKDGNNVLHYSLDEIIIKLQGLKYWLKRNIIPLTHKIHDITGVSYVNHSNGILHKLHDIQIFNIYENMTPITGKMNEAYIAPINSGSTVYTCVVDFYTIIKGLGHEEYLKDKPNPFNGMKINLPDYYNIKVRTYQTYREWEPFKIYNKGDKVKYYDKLYESVIDGNRIKNPRKYENVIKWSSSNTYQELDKVEYFGEYYTYTELGDIKNLSWEEGGLTFSSGTCSNYECSKIPNNNTIRTKNPINGTNKKINISFNSDDYEVSLYNFDRKSTGEYINLDDNQDYFDDFDVDFNYAGFEIRRKDGATMSSDFLKDIEFNIDYVYKNPQPTLDTQNWLNVTEWKEIPYKPTQVINEYRRSDNLTPFNFTLDSNIDPFVNISITSENGYGEIYSDIKNYEIRGNDDTFTEITNLPITSNPLVNIPYKNPDNTIENDTNCLEVN